MADYWRTIDTAPKDGSEMLLFWPRVEDAGGAYLNIVRIGSWKTNMRFVKNVSEEDRRVMAELNMSPSYFAPTGDEDYFCFAEERNAPTHWGPLPGPPTR